MSDRPSKRPPSPNRVRAPTVDTAAGMLVERGRERSDRARASARSSSSRNQTCSPRLRARGPTLRAALVFATRLERPRIALGGQEAQVVAGAASQSRVPSLLPSSTTISSVRRPGLRPARWRRPPCRKREAVEGRDDDGHGGAAPVGDARRGAVVRAAIVSVRVPPSPGSRGSGGSVWLRQGARLRRCARPATSPCTCAQMSRRCYAGTSPTIGEVPLIASARRRGAFARALRGAAPDVAPHHPLPAELCHCVQGPAAHSHDRVGARPTPPRRRRPRSPSPASRAGPREPQGKRARSTAPDAHGRPPLAPARAARSLFASPAPDALAPKAPPAYAHDPGPLALLPNPIDVARVPGPESPRPRVAYLARLDPYKRPWLFAALARSFPAVEFVMLGQPHFSGSRALGADDLPPNLRADAGTSSARRSSASSRRPGSWSNTTVHEALAVSFQEALASRTALLGCVDTEGVVSRFGISVGPLTWRRAGRRCRPCATAWAQAARGSRRRAGRLGAAGRAWVCLRHTPERFLDAFLSLAFPRRDEDPPRQRLRGAERRRRGADPDAARSAAGARARGAGVRELAASRPPARRTSCASARRPRCARRCRRRTRSPGRGCGASSASSGPTSSTCGCS